MTTLPLLKEVLSPAVVRALGYALLHSLWQGGVLALVLAGLLPLLRQRRAELRYAVAAAALAGLVLATAGTFGYYQAVPATVAARPLVPAASATYVLLPDAAPVSAPTQARPLTWLRAASHRCEPYLPLLVGAWLLGALLMGGRLAGGLLYTGRLRRTGTHALGLDWQQRLAMLAGRAGLRRPIALLESARVAGPLVLGYLRPVILLPLGAVAGLSPALLEALLAHEVAHIVRRDYLLNLGLAVAEVVFFYHPAVWFMANCLRTARENCCDDQAAALCGGDGLRVARALAALAELEATTPAPHLALAAAGVGGRGGLLARVRRLALGGDSAPTLAEGVLASLLTVLGLLGLGTGVALAMPAGNRVVKNIGTLQKPVTVPADTTRKAKLAKAMATPDSAAPEVRRLEVLPGGRARAHINGTTMEFDTLLNPGVMLYGRRQGSFVRPAGPGPRPPQTIVLEKDKKGRVVGLAVNGQPVEVNGKKPKHGKVASTTEVIEVPAPAASRPERQFRFERPERLERIEQPELSELPESPLLSLDLSTDRLHDRTLQDAQRNLERALRSPGLNTEQFQRMRRDLERMQADVQQQRRQYEKLRLQQSPSGTLRLHLDKQMDADARQAEADHRQADVDRRQAEADRRQAEVDRRQATADAVQAVADAMQARADAREAEDAARQDPAYRPLISTEMLRSGATQARRAALRTRIAAAQAELRALDSKGRAEDPIFKSPGFLKMQVKPQRPGSFQLPVLPTPPAPPAQGRPGPPPPPPPAPPVSSDKLRDALRQDGLIGKTDRNFHFELNDRGGKVNGKALTADQVARYRQLLHQPASGKGKSSSFNMTINEN